MLIKERINLYCKNTIKDLAWPNTSDAEFAKRFLIPFIELGPKHFISNVHGTIYALQIDNQVLPVLVNDGEYQNSYVGSIYNQYISYGAHQLSKDYNTIFSLGIKYGIESFGKFLQWGNINKIVFVNNWLISTNLYPELSLDQIEMIRDFLEKKFPDHAIVFRSICSFHMQKTYELLKKSGFKMILSRPVYFLDTKDEQIFETRIFKSDLRVLNTTKYQVEDAKNLSQADYYRFSELYKMLNLDKYSKENPQFNENYIELIFKNKLVGAKLIKKEGKIYGILGYFHRNGVKTSPLFGYDTSQPKEDKLYRLMTTLLALEARKRNVILHQSSGAGSYKLLRRAKKNMEYSAIWTKHLPFKQRKVWAFLRQMVNGIATPLLKFYDP